jgi:hypothetical protein
MNIDELVVELKLDSKNFTQGQKDAIESFRKTDEEFQKRLSGIETKNKNVAYSFGDVTHAAEGLLGALAGAGMVAFARETMNSVAATGRMATNIGVATGELSAFGRMIERNGGDAQAATGFLKSLTDQVERFKLLGEASQDLQLFAGTIGAGLNSSPIEMYMKFVEWASKHRDDPKQINIIGQLGGLDQGSINQALKGQTQVLKEYQEALKGAVSPEQYGAMVRMQNAWVTLSQEIETTGRDIVTSYAPAVTEAMDATSQWVEHNQRLADNLGKVLTAIAALSALKPALWILRLLGLTNPYVAAAAASAGAAAGITGYLMPADKAKSWDEAYPTLGKIDSFFGFGGGGGGSGGGFSSQAEKEAFIRASAIKAGINPDVAMAVARSEGFNSFSGDNGTSFGAFQLHVTPGGRGHAVGDQFQSLTGLDPSNPANEHESIMFAMEWAKRHGWGDFHGAANSGIGPHQGIHVENLTVTVQSDSKNPRDHGRIAAAEIKKQLGGGIVTQANTGLNN